MRGTLDIPGLVARFGLPPGAGPALDALVDALEAEADPHTAIRGRDEIVRGHLADSLVALELAEVRAARRIADLGAGAGFPGLPLAVALAASEVDLVEAAARKCALIERLAAAAGLRNARSVHARAEQWAADAGRERYDIVTARALAPLAVLAEYAAPLLRSGGTLVAWKGARGSNEERAAAAASRTLGLEPAGVLRVEPFPGARNRHLHLYRKVKPTPDRFPRRPGVAAKRPLA